MLFIVKRPKDSHQTGNGHREADDVLRDMVFELRKTGQLINVGRNHILWLVKLNFLSYHSILIHSSIVCELCYG